MCGVGAAAGQGVLRSRKVKMSGKFFFRFGVPLAVALLAQTSCRDTPGCPTLCSTADVLLYVTGAPDGGFATGIEATLSGPTTITMSCDWYHCSGRGAVTEGNYTLRVTAPGFQVVNVPATVTVTTTSHCGCPSATLQPSTLTLNPSGDSGAAAADAVDGGMD